MSIALEIRNLNKYFGKRHVIKNLNLTARAGEVLGFLGPNGSGKTTTIKMVMGFLAVDSGEIKVCGHDLFSEYEAAMANLGGIVENPEMYLDLSGRKNLEMYARLHGKIDKQRIDELLRLVHMQERAKDKVKRYSLGMKQRIGLAQALVHRPKVLILDEPNNGLDPSGMLELRDILRKLAKEENTAIVVSSHQLAEMQQVCDRVLIIKEGVNIGEHLMSELNQQFESKQIYALKLIDASQSQRAISLIQDKLDHTIRLIAPDTFHLMIEQDQVSNIVTTLAQENIAIQGIAPVQQSLENAFINLTGRGDIIA